LESQEDLAAAAALRNGKQKNNKKEMDSEKMISVLVRRGKKQRSRFQLFIETLSACASSDEPQPTSNISYRIRCNWAQAFSLLKTGLEVGAVEVVRRNDDGDPSYMITEKGKEILAWFSQGVKLLGPVLEEEPQLAQQDEDQEDEAEEEAEEDRLRAVGNVIDTRPL
jgi:predicted transcriptional regulator